MTTTAAPVICVNYAANRHTLIAQYHALDAVLRMIPEEQTHTPLAVEVWQAMVDIQWALTELDRA